MITFFTVCWDHLIDDEFVVLRNGHEFTIQSCDNAVTSNFLQAVKLVKKRCSLNSYFVCLFTATLKYSKVYRRLVINALFKRFGSSPTTVLRVRLKMYCGKHTIDFKWNEIITRLCQEKCELDSAMAWLSTLGGAFSALGDQIEDCAVMAGWISIQQFKLALRLGDPQTVARCRLFYALSLIQRGRLKEARNLVKVVYKLVTTRFTTDTRLKRMCHGIWTKLRFER